MKIDEKFWLGVGILLLCEGMVGIILYFINGEVELIAWGITFAIGGVFYSLLIIFKPEAERRGKSIIKWKYFSILCSVFGIVGLTGGIYRNEVILCYLSGIILSWGLAAICWLRVKQLRVRSSNMMIE